MTTGSGRPTARALLRVIPLVVLTALAGCGVGGRSIHTIARQSTGAPSADNGLKTACEKVNNDAANVGGGLAHQAPETLPDRLRADAATGTEALMKAVAQYADAYAASLAGDSSKAGQLGSAGVDISNICAQFPSS